MGRVINNLGGLPADVTRDCCCGRPDAFHPNRTDGETESTRLRDQLHEVTLHPRITSKRLSPADLARLLATPKCEHRVIPLDSARRV